MTLDFAQTSFATTEQVTGKVESMIHEALNSGQPGA